jgi:hypothetical protein
MPPRPRLSRRDACGAPRDALSPMPLLASSPPHPPVSSATRPSQRRPLRPILPSCDNRSTPRGPGRATPVGKRNSLTGRGSPSKLEGDDPAQGQPSMVGEIHGPLAMRPHVSHSRSSPHDPMKAKGAPKALWQAGICRSGGRGLRGAQR